ncbi:triosephosphate isomerase [Leptolinea sp. HRD-7]|nr:triosephosphate isomerase [Leptolinea sp. HRD-7]
MRTPMVAGNWKMNKTAEQAKALVTELLPGLKAAVKVERVLCPTFTCLSSVYELIKDTNIGLGAQNLHWEASGAYTGEISASMVKEFCDFVIIGHSERRQYFGETDETVNKKVKAAQAAQLLPIVCVGETLAENEAGQTKEVVTRQLRGGLAGIEITDPAKVVIAYEPVWAIGTGRAATAQDAQNVCKIIRDELASMFGKANADAMRILYGGSVTGANAAELFAMPDIDGGLVGGASLKPDFIAIVNAAEARA